MFRPIHFNPSPLTDSRDFCSRKKRIPLLKFSKILKVYNVYTLHHLDLFVSFVQAVYHLESAE